MPVVLSCAVWGPLLVRQRVLLLCDNLSLMSAINTGSAKAPIIMHLLCCLWFFCAYFNIPCRHLIFALCQTLWQITSQGTTCQNSSNKSRLPTSLPLSVLQIISPAGPDWTSPSFRKQTVHCKHSTNTLIRESFLIGRKEGVLSRKAYHIIATACIN